MFGNMINLDEGILGAPSSTTNNDDLPTSVQEMITMKNSLIEKATSLREVTDNQRLSQHELLIEIV